MNNILTGHNDVTLDGQGTYFANLEAAVQQVVDKGEAALTPTLRTLYTDYFHEKTMTTVYGDRLKDINWAGINVNLDNFLSEEGYRSDPTAIAELSNLSVHMPGESGNLLWDDPNFGINVNWKYVVGSAVSATRKTEGELTFTATVGTSAETIELVPTAAATKGTVKVNGKATPSGQAISVALPAAENTFTVVCTAPNGTDTKTYTVKVNKDASVKAAAPVTYTDYDTYTFSNVTAAHTIAVTFRADDQALPFTDVAAGDWFYEAVRFLYEKGLSGGTSDTTFGPDATLTRAMLVTMLHRLEGKPAAPASGFTDVPNDTWYTDAVAWAAANDIVSGIGGGRFDPDAPITREQLAAILYRYARSKGYDTSLNGTLDGFNDADKVSNWAHDALRWATGVGIVSGKGGGLLDPVGEATRAEVAAMLMRFCQKVIPA